MFACHRPYLFGDLPDERGPLPALNKEKVLCNMNFPVSEIPASSKRVVWYLNHLNGADFAQQTVHVIGWNESLAIERHQDELGVDIIYKVSEAGQRLRTSIVV